MRRLATGVGRICGVVAAPTALQMAAGIRSALRETPTVELRLDWLASDAERSKLLEVPAQSPLSGHDIPGHLPPRLALAGCSKGTSKPSSTG